MGVICKDSTLLKKLIYHIIENDAYIVYFFITIAIFLVTFIVVIARGGFKVTRIIRDFYQEVSQNDDQPLAMNNRSVTFA